MVYSKFLELGDLLFVFLMEHVGQRFEWFRKFFALQGANFEELKTDAHRELVSIFW